MAARYWLGTIFGRETIPELPPATSWCKGQSEMCPTTGRRHIQLIVGFAKPQRLAAVKRIMGDGHWEATRSVAADEYVHKENSRIEGTQFEFGSKPCRRNVSHDWDKIKDLAKEGKLDEIPSDVLIRYYSSLCRIHADFSVPVGMERETSVFWGATGTGKSLRAWNEAGQSAYGKDPRSKWWCGYRGEENIVIDEFRGGIDISHMLRWTDRYPCTVETKGGSKPLVARKLWITSNLDPRKWYADLDDETLAALLRRFNITHFN